MQEIRRSPSPKGQQATRLVVGNLTRNVTEEHVREIFSPYGKLMSVDLAIDATVNLPKGYAHIEYESREDAVKAIDFMNGGQIDGNVIRCEPAFADLRAIETTMQ